MRAVSITICAYISDGVDAQDFGNAVAKHIAALAEIGRSRNQIEADIVEAHPTDVECVTCEDM